MPRALPPFSSLLLGVALPSAPGMSVMQTKRTDQPSVGRERNRLGPNQTESKEEADPVVCSKPKAAPRSTRGSRQELDCCAERCFTCWDGAHQTAQPSFSLRQPEHCKLRELRCQFPPRRYLSTNSHLLS